MTTQRHYFAEPVVRIELARVRFPKICPVCGAPASVLSRIIIAPRKPQFPSHMYDFCYGPYTRKGQQLPQPIVRVLPLYVCENHYYSSEGEEQYKSCCFIINAFATVLFLFGLFFLGDAFSRGKTLPFWSVVFFLLFVLSLFLTWVAFRPNSLSRAVQIIGFDPSMQNVLISFKNKSYRDLIIKENPMASELVSWIAKTDSK